MRVCLGCVVYVCVQEGVCRMCVGCVCRVFVECV